MIKLTRTIKTALDIVTLALASIIISGCSAIHSTEPIGTVPDPGTIETGNNIWNGPEGLTYFTHTEDNGAFVLAMIEWDQDKNQFIAKNYKGEIREIEETKVLNIWEDEEDTYVVFIAREYLDEDSAVIVWLPDRDAFEAMIESGKLPGSTEDGLLLTGSSEELTEAIKEIGLKNLFELSEPIFFQRRELEN